jgi:hypothetical protein
MSLSVRARAVVATLARAARFPVPRHPRHWRARLGALAAVAAMATAGTLVAPSPANAGCCFIPPTMTVAPCSTLGGIDWQGPNLPYYVQWGLYYTTISATSVFEPASGRFIQNTSDQTFQGAWTSTQTREVALTASFNLTVNNTAVAKTSITAATGIQVVERRTTQLGVTASSSIPPRRTMLGEYGLQSLDVIMDVGTVGMRADRVTCEYLPSNKVRHTVHIPTINEGWRFTLV